MNKLTHPGILRKDAIELHLHEITDAMPEKGYVPAYHFNIVLAGSPIKIGHTMFRIGYTNDLVWYCGHIGYGIDIEHRGHGYAAQSCLLLRNLAKYHGIDVVSLTCNPDNIASRRTCEKIGAELLGIVSLPEYLEMFQLGDREKCRYRWVL